MRFIKRSFEKRPVEFHGESPNSATLFRPGAEPASSKQFIERERIARRRTFCRIVEDAPDGNVRFLGFFEPRGEHSELIGVIIRIINARRTVKAKIEGAAPTAWFVGTRHRRRIGGRARNMEIVEQCVGLIREPACMTRFANGIALKAISKSVEEFAHSPGIEFQTRRKLDEDLAEFVAKRTNLREERIQQFVCLFQPPFMRDAAWHLHSETEMFRHACRPSCVGRRPMLPVERGIYFHCVEARCINLQLTIAGIETRFALTRNRPSCGADINHRLRTFAASACQSCESQFQCAAGEGEGKIHTSVSPIFSFCKPNSAFEPITRRPPVRLVKASRFGACFAMRARKASAASRPRLCGGN